jgi:hypothetical protein
MNRTLLRHFIKKNWIIWLGFLAFLMFEMLVCIFMMDTIAEMLAGDIMGITITGGDTLGFVGGLMPLYTSLFVMAFVIFAVFRLVYKPIDSTSLSAHLTSGMTRKRYIITAGVFLVSMIFAMFAIMYVVCGLAMLYWGPINWLLWLNLNVSYFLAILAVSAIAFFFASVFSPGNIGKLGMIGLPILFLLFLMLSSYIPFFEYLSPFGWIDGVGLAMGTFDLWWMWDLVYLGLIGAFFALSVVLFDKKQLSI